MTPIFEHGGESERDFAFDNLSVNDHLLEIMRDAYSRDAQDDAYSFEGEWAKDAARSAYRYARELERRQIERGKQ